jgi:hypothetical protein
MEGCFILYSSAISARFEQHLRGERSEIAKEGGFRMGKGMGVMKI